MSDAVLDIIKPDISHIITEDDEPVDDLPYTPRPDSLMAQAGLGLTLWTGIYEGKQDTWLRWTDLNGNILPTGAEMAEDEHQRADQAIQMANTERERAEQERERAEQERERADQERERAERLAAKLRALGVEPDE